MWIHTPSFYPLCRRTQLCATTQCVQVAEDSSTPLSYPTFDCKAHASAARRASSAATTHLRSYAASRPSAEHDSLTRVLTESQLRRYGLPSLEERDSHSASGAAAAAECTTEILQAEQAAYAAYLVAAVAENEVCKCVCCTKSHAAIASSLSDKSTGGRMHHRNTAGRAVGIRYVPECSFGRVHSRTRCWSQARHGAHPVSGAETECYHKRLIHMKHSTSCNKHTRHITCRVPCYQHSPLRRCWRARHGSTPSFQRLTPSHPLLHAPTS